MIIGVGVDIIEVGRIRQAIERVPSGPRFERRVFTVGEIVYCRKRRNAYESFAARFAAKEAVMKALGHAYGWREIEVIRSDGAPSIQLHGQAREAADRLAVNRFHLALSHTAESAIAYVIAERC